MKALHLPSNQVAQVIGFHRGRKCHMVKLDNKTNQLWTKDTTQLLGNEDMTKKILMTIAGSKGKIFDVIDRIFDTVEEAKEYLDELLKLNSIKSIAEDSGRCATLSNGWHIDCNYDLRLIIQKKAPEKDLLDTFPFDLRKASARHLYIRSNKPSNLGDDGLPTTSPTKLTATPSKKSSSKMVQLKDLTRDTRKARVVLRGLVRQKKIAKPSRWEWPEGSADLAAVKEALGK